MVEEKDIEIIYDQYKENGNTELITQIEKIIEEKYEAKEWDKGVEGGSENLLAMLMYEYATSIEALTNGGIKASDVVTKLAERMGRFRFGDFKQIDSCVSYDGDKVTSDEYQRKCRMKGTFGAHTISYKDGEEEKEAVVFFDGSQESKNEKLCGIDLHNLSDIRGTAFHEWTHVMEKSFIPTSDLRVEDIIHKEGDSTYINADVDIYMSMGEFEDYIANVDSLLQDSERIPFSGLRTVEINKKKNSNERIMHNQISEGATEYIARLIVGQVGDKVIDPTRYELQVNTIKQIFESRGIPEMLTTYFTEPQKIVTDLESIKVKETDMLHYLSDYIDFLPSLKEMIVGDLMLNGLSDSDSEKIFEIMKSELDSFLRSQPNSTEPEQNQKVSDLISRYKISSPQAQKILKQAVIGYPEMLEEYRQVMGSTFGEKSKSTLADFHDQKSDEFFEGMSSGRYSLGFTEQEIGKATVYTPRGARDEAGKVTSANLRETQRTQEQDANPSNNSFPEGQGE